MTTPHTPEDTIVEEWKMKLDDSMNVFKFNRQKQNGYRLTHDDYMEFFQSFVTTYGEAKKAEGAKGVISSVYEFLYKHRTAETPEELFVRFDKKAFLAQREFFTPRTAQRLVHPVETTWRQTVSSKKKSMQHIERWEGFNKLLSKGMKQDTSGIEILRGKKTGKYAISLNNKLIGTPDGFGFDILASFRIPEDNLIKDALDISLPDVPWTPISDNEWREEFDENFKSLDFNVSTGFGAVDLVFNMKDEVKKFIQKLLTTHSAHLVERIDSKRREVNIRDYGTVAEQKDLENHRFNEGLDQAIDIVKNN